jgi:extracellular factor (EF) 3-hydroxypalmitic acid methyl ester biosynthesis protein
MQRHSLATVSQLVTSAAHESAPRMPPPDEERAVLDNFENVSEEFLSLDAGPKLPLGQLLHATAASMHRFSAAVIACEADGLERTRLLPYLLRLRALHSRSPFVARLQTWPRGYPGDFETVEWLCDASNRAPASTVAWAIEECALQSPVAQQHRNKVGLQARAILSALVANPRARIASIGCGGCRDLSLIQDYIPAGHGRFVLVDADPDALEFARQRLPGLTARCEFVAGTVPRVLSRVMTGGGFDLVVAGGLFDYLPDRWAVATLRAVRRMLLPGGKLLFSNIASGNPFRPWLEYLAEWQLIERDEADLERLLAEAEYPTGELHIFRDRSTLAFMVDVRV